MTTKESYLKRYLESNYQEKKKRRLKKRSNLAVYDDDADWQSFTPSAKDKNQSEIEENDPDEAPVVADIKDDTIRKWQPVSSVGCEYQREEPQICVRKQKRKRMDSPDLSPKRKNEGSTMQPKYKDCGNVDISPLRQVRSSSSDLSPQRGESLNGKERQGTVSPMLQSSSEDHSLLSVMSKPSEVKVTVQHRKPLHHQHPDDTVCNHHTKTIYRDREGHKIDPELQTIEKKRSKQEDEEFILWGRG